MSQATLDAKVSRCLHKLRHTSAYASVQSLRFQYAGESPVAAVGFSLHGNTVMVYDGGLRHEDVFFASIMAHEAWHRDTGSLCEVGAARYQNQILAEMGSRLRTDANPTHHHEWYRSQGIDPHSIGTYAPQAMQQIHTPTAREAYAARGALLAEKIRRT